MKRIIILLLIINSCAYSQTNKDSIYFLNNSVVFNSEYLAKSDFKRINIIDTSYQYYFFGEVHYCYENIEMFKKNFNWLNNYNNCNSIVLEYSYSDEKRLNEFIATGDTNILKLYHRRWMKKEAVKLDSILNFVRRIYLTKKQLIKIYCIDAEERPSTAFPASSTANVQSIIEISNKNCKNVLFSCSFCSILK